MKISIPARVTDSASQDAEIKRLKREVRRLKGALRKIAAGSAGWIDIADAALKPKRGGK